MSETVFDEAKWRNFLEDYKSFQGDWKDRRLQEFASGFRCLSAGMRFVQTEVRRRAKRESPDFNVFRVLGVHEREVKTHSAFLANLLDPKGTHGQGSLFLSEFLAWLEKNENSLAINDECLNAQWQVNTEVSTGYIEMDEAEVDGRMDLVLSCSDYDLLIVVENKINAGLQPDQLQRYRRWLESRSRKKDDDNRALIYLTTSGNPPEDEDEANANPILMSYQEDIRNILGRTLPHIESPRLTDIVKQYQGIISDL